MIRTRLTRHRPARLRRLFARFDVEFRRQRVRISHAAYAVTLDVMDRGRPFADAVRSEAERFGTIEPLVVFAPEGLEAVRIVEAIVLAGRPKEAAKIAAGIIAVHYSPSLMGDSVFLVPDSFMAETDHAFPILLPAQFRIDLGPL
jgi:hypothetical protein